VSLMGGIDLQCILFTVVKLRIDRTIPGRVSVNSSH